MGTSEKFRYGAVFMGLMTIVLCGLAVADLFGLGDEPGPRGLSHHLLNGVFVGMSALMTRGMWWYARRNDPSARPRRPRFPRFAVPVPASRAERRARRRPRQRIDHG